MSGGNGKHIIGLGLNGAERTTIHRRYLQHTVVQKEVRDTGIHLKVLVVDEEPKQEQQMGRERTYTCHKATTRLLHNTNNSKSANKSLAKA